jgi:Uma2 family endonuclease
MSKATMKRANVRFNYHDYLQLPEDKRYEILDGELYVVPAPNTRHQRLVVRILEVLLHHATEKKLGEVFVAPYDVSLSDETIVQPDILFVSNARLGIIGEANISAPPDLVIEILSPSTRNKDLDIKRKIYAGFGVREYWIVDPEAETVDVLVWSEQGYTSAGILGCSERLLSSVLPELDIRISLFFETR